MLQLLELLAVLSSALFGVLLARSKQMDWVGVCSVAFIVAFGGGTLRDVLLDRRPLFWIENDHYAWIVLGLSFVGSILPRMPRNVDRMLNLPDALGLGFFSVVGTGIAQQQLEGSLLIASLFGVMTGTFGGVLGDIVSNEVPSLFRPTTPLYAVCSFTGCWVFLGLDAAGVAEAISLWSGVVVIIVMRLVALRLDLRLPATKT